MDGSVASPRPMLALGLRLLTALALATMGMLVKLAGTRGVHLFELIFWRQLITFLLIAAGLLAAGRLVLVKTRRIGAHFRRSIYGIIGMGFVYGAVILLPLAEATTISFTTPIFAALLALVLFRETIGIYRWTAVTLGIVGVVIVTQPGSGLLDPLGLAVGLIAALLVALISFQIQDLNRTESPFAIIFWFTAMTAPLGAFTLPFVGGLHDMATWAIIIGMSLCGAAAQVLLTMSLRFGSAATIIVMDYTSLIWATLYGYWVFDRLPSATLWLGAPLIVAAGAVITWREHRISVRRRQQAVDP